jgi:salicylate hydroxylase
MTSKTTKDFNLAIVGGGIAGLTLALALHHRGIKVSIYEQAPKFGEIGAGVSFSPNAVQSMKICHEGIYQSFEKVCTRNQWPSKRQVWFDFFDAYGREGEQLEASTPKFTISNSLGQNGVHRATFLDELVKLVPEGIANFGKRLKSLEQDGEGGKCVMHFEDGTSAEADAVIGCDGIKSKTRQLMHGLGHPCAQPTYTYKYAYRGVVPMAKAIEAVGEERASNSCMHVSDTSRGCGMNRLIVLTIIQAGTQRTRLDIPGQAWRDSQHRCLQDNRQAMGKLRQADRSGAPGGRSQGLCRLQQ